MKEVKHHKQQTLCQTRPAYRQGRRLTAVKTYTVNNESQHLFVYGVPKIDLFNELKSLCAKHGKMSKFHLVADHKTEIFTECFHVVYEKIEVAKKAKRLLDNKSFYGGILHVCYAPEFESMEETKSKLLLRNQSILQYKS
ncbi:RRM 5 domain containing protein [Asbolus verrucosus]|uniref:RRM 5 domain containing protein n=1 Tax=Asbolus verrucosus TaxID=1661398 RepID=A0A482WDL9_ASBVE|nr:RRM 5 domain containing protein [Asbolus verrucosus]